MSNEVHVFEGAVLNTWWDTEEARQPKLHFIMLIGGFRRETGRELVSPGRQPINICIYYVHDNISWMLMPYAFLSLAS